MHDDLPILELQEEKHKHMLDCIRAYPRILDVFQNVFSGRPLDYKVYIDTMNTLEMHIKCLYVPMLLEHKIIAADDSSENGYKPLVSQVRAADMAMNGQDVGMLALNGMKDIVESSKPTDSKDELLTAYVHGEFDAEYCQHVMGSIRESAMGAFNKPTSKDENRKKMRIAIAVKVENKE